MFGERLQSQAFVLDQDSGSESLCSVIVTWSTGNAAASDTGCKDSCCKDVRILGEHIARYSSTDTAGFAKSSLHRSNDQILRPIQQNVTRTAQ